MHEIVPMWAKLWLPGCLPDLNMNFGAGSMILCQLSNPVNSVARIKSPVFILLLLCGLRFAAAQDVGWPVHDGDKHGTRYSSLDQINAGNVDELELAWQYRTGEMQRRGEAFELSREQNIPLLVAGNLVICTPFNRIIALDPVTGRERWHFDPAVSLNMKEGGDYYACRGVAYWRDAELPQRTRCRERLLFATTDLRLFAIDAKTGQRCEEFGDNGEINALPDKSEAYRGEIQYVMPPAIIGDIAVLGSYIGDNHRVNSPSGKVRAFSVRSGEKLWEFDPIPKDPADPAMSTWGNGSAYKTGSANVWGHISVDEARDMVFLPVSSPSPDVYGGQRPGNNEYSNSLVALRGSSGKVVWHYQIVHHTLWDYDLASQPLLVDLPRGGELVPVVILNTKQGLIFTFHRETGEPFYPVEERPVPKGDIPDEWYAPTQPFPLRPQPLIRQGASPDDAWGFTFWDRGKCREQIESLRYGDIYTPPSEQGTIVSPWTGGGANWGGPAYDPSRHVMVINTSRIMKASRLTRRDKSSGLENESGPVHYGEPEILEGTPYVYQDALLLSPLGAPCSKPPWGGLTAVDMATATILWDVPLGSIEEFLPIPITWNLGTPNIGGPIVTAGGLVFIAATADRVFRAFDIETGEQLWRHELPAVTMTTPITYLAGGRQYIVIVSGGHNRIPGLRGDYVVAYALPQ